MTSNPEAILPIEASMDRRFIEAVFVDLEKCHHGEQSLGFYCPVRWRMGRPELHAHVFSVFSQDP